MKKKKLRSKVATVTQNTMSQALSVAGGACKHFWPMQDNGASNKTVDIASGSNIDKTYFFEDALDTDKVVVAGDETGTVKLKHWGGDIDIVGGSGLSSSLVSPGDKDFLFFYVAKYSEDAAFLIDNPDEQYRIGSVSVYLGGGGNAEISAPGGNPLIVRDPLIKIHPYFTQITFWEWAKTTFDEDQILTTPQYDPQVLRTAGETVLVACLKTGDELQHWLCEDSGAATKVGVRNYTTAPAEGTDIDAAMWGSVNFNWGGRNMGIAHTGYGVRAGIDGSSWRPLLAAEKVASVVDNVEAIAEYEQDYYAMGMYVFADGAPNDTEIANMLDWMNNEAINNPTGTKRAYPYWAHLD